MRAFNTYLTFTAAELLKDTYQEFITTITPYSTLNPEFSRVSDDMKQLIYYCVKSRCVGEWVRYDRDDYFYTEVIFRICKAGKKLEKLQSLIEEAYQLENSKYYGGVTHETTTPEGTELSTHKEAETPASTSTADPITNYINLMTTDEKSFNNRVNTHNIETTADIVASLLNAEKISELPYEAIYNIFKDMFVQVEPDAYILEEE